ncbi:MAG: hypothetical protein HZB26_05755 [Candidatus Hydrogenedentes bacterium]|nr:hypothetical protein [Candidatus Hydrogenedentota bacterium]
MILADTDPSLWLLILVTWPVYILPSLVTLPALFWRVERSPWSLGDVLIVAGPWAIWAFVFMSTPDVERRVIHAVIESFVMGCTVPAGLGAMILGKDRFGAKALRAGFLAFSGLLAMVLCTWFFRIVD